MAKRNKSGSLGQTGKQESIYAELDCLLDTRLGTIARIDPEAAKTLLSNGWRTRMQDVYEGVDMVAFRELFANRDQYTLAHSFQTACLELLRDIALSLREQAVKRPYHDGGALTVNYWPYKLSPEEIAAYQANIFAALGRQAPVYLRSISPRDLTPKYIKSSFSLVVMYDYDAWLSMHKESFEKRIRIPEVSMFSPAIYFKDELPSETEMAKCKAEGVHPLKAVEAAASPLVELNLLDVKYFSAVDIPK